MSSRYLKEKPCAKCGGFEFYIKGNKCVACKAAYHKARRLAQPEYYRKAALKWASKNREKASAIALTWAKENRSRKRANNSNYRCVKLQRTTAWSELELIAEFYKNCPDGYHVDHVIPLQGELVSGLHVLANLQYLPASENCSKGNKFVI